MKILKKTSVAAILAALTITFAAMQFTGGLKASAAAAEADTNGYLPVPAGAYSFDKNHGVIGFGIQHLGIAIVEGRFKDFTGTVNFDDKDVTRSTVEFSAKIDSVDTGVTPRNNHLKTADFFDAAKFPEMTFKSTKVTKKGKGYILTGDLTIKGVTKSISFPFTMTGAVKDPWGGTRFGIEAATRINRRDFGINYGNVLPSGILDVANDVDITLHLEAVKAQPAAGK